ncbi:fungal-specific transcription factor domain-containing protein [Xylariales sp. PMI_506]|nr:fungal-specific transcription factor domain-containing protein [Xylariales sp. PMI_506]
MAHHGSGMEHSESYQNAFDFTPTSFDSSSALPAYSIRKPLPAFDTQDVNPASVATTQQQREHLKAKRRVPASQRKRTKLSCDACKARRCKCLRMNPPQGSNEAEDDDNLAPCKNCLDAGIECVTTMPRKQRIYGSIENLDRRYRAMDALVCGVFPQLARDATADELVTFGREMGLAMPDLDSDYTSAASSTATSALLSPAIQSPTKLPARPFSYEYDSKVMSNYLSKKAQQYVGPSGTLGIFAAICNVAKRRLTVSTHPEAQKRIEQIASSAATEDINSSFHASSELSGSDKWGHGPDVSRSSQRRTSESHTTEPRQRIARHQSVSDNLHHWIPISSIKLPSRKVADACVNAFFEHVHPDFILIHRDTFQQGYEGLWKPVPRASVVQVEMNPRETHVSAAWLCCLYTIFILGSRSLPRRPDSLEFQRTYSAAVKELPSMLHAPNLQSVCAFMLLALYSHNTNDLKASWTYHGVACRLAVSLGMHRENAGDGLNTLDIQIRKRVWWTLYDYEQHLCSLLGRPSALESVEIDVDAPDESFLKCAPDSPPQYAEYSVQMMRLLNRIRVYDMSSTAATKLPGAFELIRSLLMWSGSLPAELQLAASEDHPLSHSAWRRVSILHIQYRCAIIFLTRRFLLEEVDSFDRSIHLGSGAYSTSVLSKICVSSAMQCINLLVRLWQAKCFNGISWIDIYYAYVATMQISLRLLAPDALTGQFGQPGIALDMHRSLDHETLETGTTKPHTAIDYELDALVLQSDLVRSHTLPELTDAVRQINDLLKTVEMSGFSAQCHSRATELGKAVGAVDGKPESTLFGGSLGTRMDSITSNFNRTARPFHTILDSQHLPGENHAGAAATLTEMQGLYQSAPLVGMLPGDFSAAPMNVENSGVLNPDNWDSFNAPHASGGVQWDMVMQPDQWQHPYDVLMDAGSDIWTWPNHPVENPYGGQAG